jgi:VWFA-related protein
MDLDVVVTDKAGRPVTDLKREDFSVKLGGKVFPVDYFAHVEEGTVQGSDLATASPDQLGDAERAANTAHVPRRILMYVDLGHLAPDGRRRGLEALRDLVGRMGPADRGRLVLFDRRSRPMIDWTSSRDELLDSLSRVDAGFVGMSRLMTEREALQSIEFTSRAETREFLARAYAQQERAEVGRLLQDLELELATLAPFSGKKVFLLVSGGFDFHPGYAMMAYALGRPSTLALDLRNFSEELERITRRANASEVTFYTVDARGLDVVGSAMGDTLLDRPNVAFLARNASQEGLVFLAHETGGLAIRNTNDLRGETSRLYQDTSSYYSLGITVSRNSSLGYRDVRVDVGRRGLRARTRRGFAVRSDDERARDGIYAGFKGDVLNSPIPISIRLHTAEKTGKFYELPISVVVPSASLTFTSGNGPRKASAALWIGAIDDDDRTSDIAREEATFLLPDGADGANSASNYFSRLRIRGGKHRIVVYLRDRASGRIGVARIDTRVEESVERKR